MKQRYGTELRSRTLASIKPEISQALDSLLDEVHNGEDAKAMRAFASRPPNAPRSASLPTVRTSRFPSNSKPRPTRIQKTCPLCKQVSRSDIRHFLSECTYLPEHDRKYILKARQVADIFDDQPADHESDHEGDTTTPVPHAEPPLHSESRYVSIPTWIMFYDNHTTHVTIDSGATSNMIRAFTAKRLGAHITESSRSAHQADGSSPLTIVGETRLTLTRENRDFLFEGLVVDNLNVDILAGIPFMAENDIAIRPAKRQISLGDGSTVIYGSPKEPPSRNAIRRAHVLHAPSASTTVWPGDFIEPNLPDDMSNLDNTFALEPRTDTPGAKPTNTSLLWPRPD